MPLTFEAPVRSFVPQGQPKIAQPFKAGCGVAVVLSPVRDDRTRRFSVLPDGTSGTTANPYSPACSFDRLPFRLTGNAAEKWSPRKTLHACYTHCLSGVGIFRGGPFVRDGR